MLLRTNKGEKLFFKIEGNTQNEDNWLKVSINAQLNAIQWKASDKCLRLKEVKDLIAWFNAIANKELEIIPALSFLESELEFVLKSNPADSIRHIQMVLDHRLLPKNRLEALSINLTVGDKELKRIIEGLKAQIAL